MGPVGSITIDGCPVRRPECIPTEQGGRVVALLDGPTGGTLSNQTLQQGRIGLQRYQVLVVLSVVVKKLELTVGSVLELLHLTQDAVKVGRWIRSVIGQ